MKHSIARIVTWRVLLLILFAVILLFTASFLIVRNVISVKNDSYSHAIVTAFTDLVLYDAQENGVPVDEEHADIIVRRGGYICDWYDVDYAYIYVPDSETGTVRYVAAVQGADAPEEARIENNLIGYVPERTMTAEEWAVWNGEKLFGQLEFDNQYGHEFGTILRIEDTFGNRMIGAVDMSYDEYYRQTVHFLHLSGAMTILVMIALYAAIYWIIRCHVTVPAKVLSEGMQAFITDGKRVDVRLDEDESNEFSMIARAFNSMTGNIDRYTDDIRTLTREQEQQHTQLEIAARIQTGFLPKDTCESSVGRIHAMMTPARDIGGDLYDYLLLDDHRMLVVIGDVAGKGVAASIFMAATLMLIHQFAEIGLSPAETLKRTNDSLSGNNAALLFATVFIGIYDDQTHKLTYANAGHDVPYIIGKTLRKLDAEPGTLLGLYAGENYTETETDFLPGETLFLYTDGVNEATNAVNAFYGTERLEETLRTVGNADDAISGVYGSVQRFTGGVAQHDDITMLALTAGRTREYSLDVRTEALETIRDAILSLPTDRETQMALCVAAEECFVNICTYGYPNGVPDGEKVRFTLDTDDGIVMRFEDGGVPYDPTENVRAADDYDIDTQIGGLGDYIAFSSVDDVRYEYKNQKNILTMIKHTEVQ